MANAINMLKPHLITGSSVPLALLLGCFVAPPLELGSLAVVTFILVVLSLLLLAWNSMRRASGRSAQPARFSNV
jgi:hypothetical protein